MQETSEGIRSECAFLNLAKVWQRGVSIFNQFEILYNYDKKKNW